MPPKSNVHTHTRYSDGRDSAEEMVQAALRLGFHTLGFSEHGPADYDGAAMPADRAEEYRAEIARLKRAYAGQIDLLLGVEHDWLSPADFAPCTATTARTPPGIAVSERVW